MSAERYTIDTNLYFYSLDASAGDKHLRALALLQAVNPLRTVVLMQTLGELANSIVKRRPALSGPAEQLIRRMSRLELAQAIPDDLHLALATHQQHKLPFWDAVIWATARRVGCSLLLSEDFQDRRTLDGVTICNPFKLSAAELDALLA